MYRTRIQRRSHGPSMASMAVGALVVVLLMLLTYGVVREFAQLKDYDEPRNLAEAPAMTLEAKQFIGFIQAHSAEARMGLEHGYTSDGIRYLSAALGSLVRQDNIRGLNVEQRRGLLARYADRLQENGQATDHAGLAREAFITASDLFADLANKRYPDQRDQVWRLRQAAQAIDSNRLLLNQQAQVQEFFTQASATLQAMSQASGKGEQLTTTSYF